MKSHNSVLRCWGTFISADSRFEDQLSAPLSREMRWDTRYVSGHAFYHRGITVISVFYDHFRVPLPTFVQVLRRVIIIDVLRDFRFRRCDIRLQRSVWTNSFFFLSFLARTLISILLLFSFSFLYSPLLFLSLSLKFSRDFFGKSRNRDDNISLLGWCVRSTIGAN